MNRTVKIIIICIIGAFVIAGGVYLLVQNNTPAKTNTSDNHSHDADDAHTDTPPAGTTATITYTNNGFSPKSLTVTSGTTITIKNDSSEDLLFSSDDHPTHTHNAELNETTLGPSQSQTITTTTKGTWGYHNHIDASKTGTLIVQ